MSKPSPSSVLYRLIAAGQLAHKALLVPLKERGLEPGDDAVLFALGRSGTTEEALAAELGLPLGVALTERGIRIRNSLADHWAQLEEALLGELKPKHRKRFGKILARFTDLLQF
jgi:hypothetical protein